MNQWPADAPSASGTHRCRNQASASLCRSPASEPESKLNVGSSAKDVLSVQTANTASALVLNRAPERGSQPVSTPSAATSRTASSKPCARNASRSTASVGSGMRPRCSILTSNPLARRACSAACRGRLRREMSTHWLRARSTHRSRLRCSRTIPGIAPTETYSTTKSVRGASSIHATGSNSREGISAGIAEDGPTSEATGSLRTDWLLKSRVPRHSGNCGQPQNRPPAFRPVFAVRSSIDAPHDGQGGGVGVESSPTHVRDFAPRASK